MKKTKSIALLLIAVMMLSFTSCYGGVYQNKGAKVEGATNKVKMTVKDYGEIVVELYPDVAPITVANFQQLVKDGFYDGLTFHRVAKGFVIQCGDPTGTGLGGSDKTIKGEFAANGVENNLSHERGVISMGRKSTGYDTASSHFFICLDSAKTTSLDGSYAAFGKVIEGMDVVDAIAAVSVDSNDKPLNDVIVEKMEFVD